jgi:hypothetical protein
MLLHTRGYGDSHLVEIPRIFSTTGSPFGAMSEHKTTSFNSIESNLVCHSFRVVFLATYIISWLHLICALACNKGTNLALGAQLIDYVVLIGSGRCVGKELTDNVLRCQPPVDEPLVDGSSNNKCAEHKLNSVMVRKSNHAKIFNLWFTKC